MSLRRPAATPNRWKRLYNLVAKPTHSTLLQVPRALVVSALAAGLDVLVLVLLVEVAGWATLWAATVSYLLGGVLQYILCARWVFSTLPRNAVIGFTTFTLLSLVGLAITVGVIWVLNVHTHVSYLIAKVVALGLAFCWNFASRKYFIFKEARESSCVTAGTPPEPKIPVS